ncbi:hypothetical protein LEP1GSC081_3731 [Leptospira kirschneri str. H1]|uniref:Uncharacterized protein n=1 Tax=Leptospira kirschneri str. H1 TaxID=1049966 RepID=A0A0E2B486_9LEPT|nr:hypothetical protein LEP1GSC081_3731 [Leptospira kirschneri str. H1]
MEELFSKLGYSGLFGIIWTSFLIRYLLFSGISFWVVWILFEKKFFHKLIQGKKPAKENIIHEVKYSFVTFFIFALSGVFVVWAKRNGYNQIYENVEDYV